MPWFSDSRNDPLAKQEKNLKSQIAAVEKQIRQLEKARKKVEKGEEPEPVTNPFEDPITLLKKRKKLFSNPEDEKKYRLVESNRLNTAAEEVAREQQAEAEERHAQSAERPMKPRDEWSQTVNKLVREGREDPNAPTDEDSRFLKYLAAGNLEGMKKLQYEKGVVRNRKIVMGIAIALLASIVYLMMRK